MKIKEFYNLLSILLGLFPALAIGKPYDPNLLSAFIENGKRFDQVISIKIEFGNYGEGVCSGVRARTPKGKLVILTAAHCLQTTSKTGQTLRPSSMVAANIKVTHYFEHPYFQIAPQYDLAVLLVPDRNSGEALNFYQGSPENLLNEKLAHVGYTRNSERALIKQAFEIFPNRVTQTLIEQSPFQNKVLLGEAVYGDSGGPLLLKNASGDYEIAALFSFILASTHSRNINQWVLITPDFIRLLDSFLEQGPIVETKNLINETGRVRQLWMSIKENPDDCDQVEEILRSSAESQFYFGLAAEDTGQAAAAMEYFQKSASQDYALANLAIGDRLLSSSPQQAVKFLEKAADQNVPEAFLQLAKCYYLGVGYKKNPNKAVTFYQKALEQGPYLSEIVNELIQVSFELAQLYYNRGRFPADFLSAAQYFEIAGNLGDADAIQNLSIVYFDLSQKYSNLDTKNERLYLQKAAQYGHKKATRLLQPNTTLKTIGVE